MTCKMFKLRFNSCYLNAPKLVQKRIYSLVLSRHLPIIDGCVWTLFAQIGECYAFVNKLRRRPQPTPSSCKSQTTSGSSWISTFSTKYHSVLLRTDRKGFTLYAWSTPTLSQILYLLLNIFKENMWCVVSFGKQWNCISILLQREWGNK